MISQCFQRLKGRVMSFARRQNSSEDKVVALTNKQAM